MTEYELAELVAIYSSNGSGLFATYLTLISGYLITAFLAGARLNTLQVTILNVGFVFAASIVTFATFGALMTQVAYTMKLLVLAPGAPQIGRGWLMKSLCILMAGGTLASLYVMWNSRHPKT